LEFVFRLQRVRIVAVGFGHLVVIAHGHLHLSVRGFRQKREEYDEVFITVDGLRDICGAALFVIRVRDG